MGRYYAVLGCMILCIPVLAVTLLGSAAVPASAQVTIIRAERVSAFADAGRADRQVRRTGRGIVVDYL